MEASPSPMRIKHCEPIDAGMQTEVPWPQHQPKELEDRATQTSLTMTLMATKSIKPPRA